MTTGRNVAAFFDIDGTLMPAPSLEWRFITFLVWRDKLSTRNILRWVGQTALLSTRGLRAAIQTNKSYLAGISDFAVTEWTSTFKTARGPSSLPIFESAIDRVRWHQSLNHHVFLISGTLAPLAKSVAALMPGTASVVASELEVASAQHLGSSYFTGELAGEHLVGDEKLKAVQILATRHGLDLVRCYAYGNELADYAMLAAVGNPRAVNPSRALARTARRWHWPILHWENSFASDSAAQRQDRIHIVMPPSISGARNR